MSIPVALALFGLISLSLVGLSIMHTYATQGFAFGFSSNRGTPGLSPLAVRIQRTLQNQTEAAAYAVPALAGAALFQPAGPGIELAALLIVVGRAAYAVLYLSGISFIRVPAFVLGTLSSIYLIALVVMSM